MQQRFLLLFLVLAGCSATTTSTTPAPKAEEPATESDSSSTTPPEETGGFTAAEVQELFDTKCVRCHSGTASTPLDLRSFERTTIDVAVGTGRTADCSDSAQQKRIVPGDRAASLLWQKVNGMQDCGDAMPPPGKGTKLTASELERLGLYIDALASENQRN